MIEKIKLLIFNEDVETRMSGALLLESMNDPEVCKELLKHLVMEEHRPIQFFDKQFNDSAYLWHSLFLICDCALELCPESLPDIRRVDLTQAYELPQEPHPCLGHFPITYWGQHSSVLPEELRHTPLKELHIDLCTELPEWLIELKQFHKITVSWLMAFWPDILERCESLKEASLSVGGNVPNAPSIETLSSKKPIFRDILRTYYKEFKHFEYLTWLVQQTDPQNLSERIKLLGRKHLGGKIIAPTSYGRACRASIKLLDLCNRGEQGLLKKPVSSISLFLQQDLDLPQTICTLPDLNSLSVSSYKKTVTLPEQPFVNLKELSFKGCVLPRLPDWLFAEPKLKLHLHDCDISTPPTKEQVKALSKQQRIAVLNMIIEGPYNYSETEEAKIKRKRTALQEWGDLVPQELLLQQFELVENKDQFFAEIATTSPEALGQIKNLSLTPESPCLAFLDLFNNLEQLHLTGKEPEINSILIQFKNIKVLNIDDPSSIDWTITEARALDIPRLYFGSFQPPSKEIFQNISEKRQKIILSQFNRTEYELGRLFYKHTSLEHIEQKFPPSKDSLHLSESQRRTQALMRCYKELIRLTETFIELHSCLKEKENNSSVTPKVHYNPFSLSSAKNIYLYSRWAAKYDPVKTISLKSLYGFLLKYFPDLAHLELLDTEYEIPSLSCLKSLRLLGQLYNVEHIFTHPNLEVLELQHLNFDNLNEFPDKWNQLANLKTLKIKETTVSSWPASFKTSKTLTELHLCDCELNSLDLSQMKQLQKLRLTGSSINGPILLPPQLKHLSISQAPSAIKAINWADLKALESLWMQSCELTSFPPEITSVNTLKELSLSHNPLLSFKGVELFYSLEKLLTHGINTELPSELSKFTTSKDNSVPKSTSIKTPTAHDLLNAPEDIDWSNVPRIPSKMDVSKVKHIYLAEGLRALHKFQNGKDT